MKKLRQEKFWGIDVCSNSISDKKRCDTILRKKY